MTYEETKLLRVATILCYGKYTLRNSRNLAELLDVSGFLYHEVWKSLPLPEKTRKQLEALSGPYGKSLFKVLLIRRAKQNEP